MLTAHLRRNIKLMFCGHAMISAGVGGRVWKHTMWKWECYSACGRRRDLLEFHRTSGPEAWLQLRKSKLTFSTRQHIFGRLYVFGKTNDGCSLQNFLHVDPGPDSRSITWPSLEVLHPTLENTRCGYWLCILGILV